MMAALKFDAMATYVPLRVFAGFCSHSHAFTSALWRDLQFPALLKCSPWWCVSLTIFFLCTLDGIYYLHYASDSHVLPSEDLDIRNNNKMLCCVISYVLLAKYHY